MNNLGIDLGSFGLESVLVNENGERVWSDHALTDGEPVDALQKMVKRLTRQYDAGEIKRVGVTGSGWRLAKAMLGAEYAGEEMVLLQAFCEAHYPQLASIVKIGYEETAVCHLHQMPKRRGRRNECIRNLGAFYQQQLERWQMSEAAWNHLEIERGNEELHISAKCPAFMLRDMLKYEQMGLPKALIASKLDEALVRCYLQNTAKDDVFSGEILFIGRLAASRGAIHVLKQETGQAVWADEDNCFLSAEAAAVQVGQMDAVEGTWRGQLIAGDRYDYGFAHCEDGCERHCALTQFIINQQVQAVWGGKCDRWDNFIPTQNNAH